MEPAAFVWFMIATTWGGNAVLPVPYQTQEMCVWAADNAVPKLAGYSCIPQPAGDLAQFSYLSSTDGFEGDLTKR